MPVTPSSLARCIVGTALTVLLAAAPIEFSAQARAASDASDMTAAGAYLAARHASQMRDAAKAAEYYRDALRRDPKNADLLNRTFLSLIIGGEIKSSLKYAERVVRADKNDRIGRLVLGVHALKEKRYRTARYDLTKSVHGPITDLTATLLAAWSLEGEHRSRSAVTLIDGVTGADWYAIFKDLHAGMILDLGRHEKDAGKRLAQAYNRNSSALRVVEAYGSWLSRNKSPAEALKVFEAFDKKLPNHPLVMAAMKTLKAGKKLPPVVTSAGAGAAEALYGLGASLGRGGGEDLGLLYLQLALYLEPHHTLALLSLAELYDSIKKPELALNAYERIAADSPLHRNAAIEMSSDLDALGRTAEAKAKLEGVLKKSPDDVEALMAFGNLLRVHKEWDKCGPVYSRAIATLKKPDKSNWGMFYFRGICYERNHQWPKAEADFKQALALYPDQPHVLNYLGYSWIDKGKHLDEGMAMIKKAVQKRPDDGYIVNSLGWAYYKLGNYAEAVKQLQRAIELKPADPTINDHFGDALWRVGRKLDAHYQWIHARDMKPDPAELAKIEAKLKHGLPEEHATQATTTTKKKPGDGG